MQKKPINWSMSLTASLCLILVSLAPLAFNVSFTRSMVLHGLNQLEESQYFERLKQSMYLLDKTKNDLISVATDYAVWDEMYQQVQSPDYSWLNRNITNSAPENFGIDSILLLNSQGKIIYQFQKLSVCQAWLSKQSIVRKVLNGQQVADYFAMPEGLFFVVVTPVLPADGKKQPKGVLLFAKKLDNSFMRTLDRQFDERIAIEFNDNWAGIIETVIMLPDLKPLSFDHSRDIPYKIIRPRNDVIVIYTTVKDMIGNDINIIVSARRTAILTTIHYIENSILPAVITAFICVFILGFLLTKYFIFKPFHTLSLGLLDIKKSGKLKQLCINGPKEITDLADVFNEMSTDLELNIARAKMLELQVNTDSLTGLYGYRFLNEYICNLSVMRAKFALLFCDLDHFKKFNEMFGHIEGDRVLKKIAQVIGASIQNKGIVTRYGGDEFLVVLPDIDDISAFVVADQIRKNIDTTLRQAIKINEFPYIGISIGIAIYPDDATRIDELIANADKAMYYAKQMGRNQVQRFTRNIALDVVKKSTDQIREELLFNSVKALANAVDLRDSYTGKHSEAVASIAFILAKAAGMPESECIKIKMAGLLHDLGKIGIPDQILLKNDHLSLKEYNLLKTHPMLGANIITHLNILEGIEDWVRYHHERFDGKGYPKGLKGAQIPLGARIIAIADAYHAMVSDRPYRKALNEDEVIAELLANEGNHFDPTLVEIFINLIPALKI